MCGSGPRAISPPAPASKPSPTPSTPRSTSAAATRSSAAAPGRHARSPSGTPSGTGTCRSGGRSSQASAVPPTPDPAGLGETLASLPVLVEDVACDVGSVTVPAFGGARPTSVVTLRGRRTAGRGENIAWTEAAQDHFAMHARVAPRGGWCLGDWSAAMREVIAEPYERAALEAAALDLALRQARTSPFQLAMLKPSPV